MQDMIGNESVGYGLSEIGQDKDQSDKNLINISFDRVPDY